ncbi:MAG TPA: alkaline phosphatase D family protein [Solirubrobacter sp.]|nr:alkaline phosphatase D family protein [Solirubrobacter sp.]
MGSSVWVTCGAPLATGDGWRVWYSWPGAPATPQPPRVRTLDGTEQRVSAAPFDPPPAAPPGSKRTMGTREIRIENATPGATYDVTIPETGETHRWRTLPPALPPEGMSLLIASCFWLNDDKDGYYAAAIEELVQRERPVFKVLMGDQLYVDVWAPLPHSVPQGLAAKYERYWGDTAYRGALAACPTVVTSDDHEFWNDFPEPQIQVPLSWDRYQPRTANALATLYDAYQCTLNPQAKRWYEIDVPPVSFFVADTRSNRTKDDDPHARLMVPEQWRDLENWAKRLNGPGVLVLPQPLLKQGGSKTDRTLLDFKESDRLGAIFEHALQGPDPHDILILTGDIHTGRLSAAEIVGLDGTIYELVASPASLVTPFLPPWGHKPSALPAKLTINRRSWRVTAHQRLTSTVDNNVGLVRIAPGRNGRTRFTLQLWRVRPYIGPARRIFGRKPAKGAQPLHDPIDIELR